MIFVTLHELSKSVRDTESAYEYNLLKQRNFYHFDIRLKSPFLEPFSFAIDNLYLRFWKEFSLGINRSVLFLYYTGKYYKIRVVKEKQVFHSVFCQYVLLPVLIMLEMSSVQHEAACCLNISTCCFSLFTTKTMACSEMAKQCYNGFQNSPSHLRKFITIEQMECIGTKMRNALFCIVHSFRRILAGKKTLAS